MKRTIVILLLLSILLTGCSEVTSDVAITDKNQVQEENLIIEEQTSVATEEELVTYIDTVDYQVEVIKKNEEAIATPFLFCSIRSAK